jgi:NDP-sugar pyrophosphorylase family protein
MAGGKGTRLGKYTRSIPKPLLPLGDLAIIEIQILQLKKSEFNKIYIMTGFKSDYISKFLGDGQRYGVQLIYIHEKTPLGTAGPLKLLEEYIDDYFLLINCDVLTDLNFANFYKKAILDEKSLMTVALASVDINFPFGRVIYDNYVKSIHEKPRISVDAVAGIYVIHKNIFKYIQHSILGMDELINKLLETNESVKAELIEGYWLDIGNEENYERAIKERECLKNF